MSIGAQQNRHLQPAAVEIATGYKVWLSMECYAKGQAFSFAKAAMACLSMRCTVQSAIGMAPIAW